MSILEQIEANAITELVLSQGPDEYCDSVTKLSDSLRDNKTIEIIRLEGDFLGDLRNDSRIEILEAIGCIPTLKEVHLFDSLLLVRGITKMTSSAGTLRTLVLKNLVLQGIEPDFDAFEAVLYRHPNLKTFEVVGCVPAVKDISLEKLTASAEMLRTTIGNPNPKKMNAQTA